MIFKNEGKTKVSRPEVIIVTAKCRHNGKLYGIRIENMENVWVVNWAFSIREDVASREGYSQREVRGQFAISEDYPGCPYCAATGLVKCGCGKTYCYDGKAKITKCPWCHRSGLIGGEIDRLSAGSDR